jgi:hypothetical protein
MKLTERCGTLDGTPLSGGTRKRVGTVHYRIIHFPDRGGQ